MKRWLSAGCVLALTLLAPIAALAQQTARPLGSTSAPYGFYEYLPVGYASGGPWPLIIFLHGSGERGNGTTDLHLVLRHGFPKKINAGTQYPAVILSPQGPPSTLSWSMANLDALINYAMSNYDIDPDRISMTGLSMGGFGTWTYGRTFPGKLAAALPMCGSPSTTDGSKFVDVPTWTLHRWKDAVTPASNTIRWADAVAGALTGDPPTNVMASYPGDPDLATIPRTASYSAATKTWTWKDGIVQVAGSHPTFTLYNPRSTGDNHDCWTDTYNSQTVTNWLLAQRRNPDLQLITPAAAGASAGYFYPMQLAFDAQPTLSSANEPVGGTGGSDMPGYASRVGYIDFGPNWQKVRISSTWTRYRVSSGGNQTPYIEVWWDDDTDDLNDNGFSETRVNFNSAQNLSTGSTEPWLRDRDLSLNPVAPRARYLICRTPANMTWRAKEYAIVGYIVP